MTILPHVLGIGAQKAGTSWLHENLKQNKSLWMPPFKEIHFFDHKFVPPNRTWTDWHLNNGLERARETWKKQGILNQKRLDWLYEVTSKPRFNGNWYKKIFSLCPEDRLPVDITPEYSSIPKEGINFVARFLGADFKAIYVIREPVERALSQLRMNLRRKKLSPKSRDEWLGMAMDDQVMERGDYLSHVARWQKERPAETLLFIPFGQIARAPHEVMRQVEEFIGVPTANYDNLERKVYATSDFQIPDYVREALEERLQPQVAFIKDRFGAEFYEKSR
ncbi:sulfotransferase domain-containing protein [Paracoccus saliphilus]|uniref:Sulfotransferase n=1 Tax=Paracoccus saliphilus TaxID=405559 RepID=A0AA46A625_9RHOB|nr:sulfotransferase domain-containing protein [Paracoccus saliphilus]WCR02164.1 sulfotransferase [Paracoccus saliphilus]SIS90719.1 Sulfotransferase family protein [Paracoccus saliphilus]